MKNLISPKQVTTIIKIARFLRINLIIRTLFFNFRALASKYRKIKRFSACIDGVEVVFSTEDLYSNIWFLPRYAGGKLHEEPVTRLLAERLKSAKIFADVGTNLGWYTCLAAKLMPNGSVIGFDMDNSCLSLVRRNLELNKCTNVQLVHAAVTDHLGTVSYQNQSKYPSPDLQISTHNVSKKHDNVAVVEAITLDDFFAQHTSVPDVLKIDVEGAEMDVLRGMTNLFERRPLHLFVEVHPSELPMFHSSIEEVVTFLSRRGFQVFEIRNIRKREQDVHLVKLDNGFRLKTNTMLYAYKQ